MEKHVVTLAAVSPFAATAAMADYPEKPVSFVAPRPRGDLEDVLTSLSTSSGAKGCGSELIFGAYMVLDRETKEPMVNFTDRVVTRTRPL